MIYTMTQAAKHLGIDRHRLCTWQRKGLLKDIIQDKRGKHFSKDELETIHDLITPPDDSQSLIEIGNQYSLSRRTVEKLLREFEIAPIQTHVAHQLSVSVDYYLTADLTHFGDQLLAYHKQHHQEINLIPNTKLCYRHEIDLSIADLMHLLGQRTNNTRAVYYWIQYHRIDGNYCIDRYG